MGRSTLFFRLRSRFYAERLMISAKIGPKRHALGRHYPVRLLQYEASACVESVPGEIPARYALPADATGPLPADEWLNATDGGDGPNHVTSRGRRCGGFRRRLIARSAARSSACGCHRRGFSLTGITSLRQRALRILIPFAASTKATSARAGGADDGNAAALAGVACL